MTELLWWLFQTTVTVAVLVAIVGMACRCLRRWPAVQHALWVIVLVKLVTPPVVSWPWTARDLLPASRLNEVAAEIPETGDNVWPVSKTDSNEAIPIAIHRGDIVRSDDERRPLDTKESLSPESTSPHPNAWTQTSIAALFGVWLAGGVFVFARQLRQTIRLRRAIGAGRPAPQPLSREVEVVAEMLRMQTVETRVSPRISSPLVCCLGRPRLLWPEALCDQLDAYRSVIAHELAHVKRRDHWVAWLVLFAGCLWWWNPLFWFLRRRLSESAEFACDAMALGALPEERTRFAKALLQLSQRVPETRTPVPALGADSGTCQTFKRRFSMIFNDRVHAKLPKAGLLLVLMLAALAVPSWALERPAAENPEKGAARKPAGKKNEIDKLNGTWDVTHIVRNGAKKPMTYQYYRWTFDAKTGKVTTEWKRKEGDIGLSRGGGGKNGFTIDAAKTPKQITIAGERMRLFGIYELKGDVLRVATFGKSEFRHPGSFDAAKVRKDFGPLMIFVLKQKPEPKKTSSLLNRFQKETTVKNLKALLTSNGDTTEIEAIGDLGRSVSTFRKITYGKNEYTVVIARKKTELSEIRVAFIFNSMGKLVKRLGGRLYADGNCDDVQLTSFGTKDRWFVWISRFISTKEDPFSLESDIHLVEPGFPLAFRVRHHANATAWTNTAKSAADSGSSFMAFLIDGNTPIKKTGIGRDGKRHLPRLTWNPKSKKFHGPGRAAFGEKLVFEVDAGASRRFTATDETARRK